MEANISLSKLLPFKVYPFPLIASISELEELSKRCILFKTLKTCTCVFLKKKKKKTLKSLTPPPPPTKKTKNKKKNKKKQKKKQQQLKSLYFLQKEKNCPGKFCRFFSEKKKVMIKIDCKAFWNGCSWVHFV